MTVQYHIYNGAVQCRTVRRCATLMEKFSKLGSEFSYREYKQHTERNNTLAGRTVRGVTGVLDRWHGPTRELEGSLSSVLLVISISSSAVVGGDRGDTTECWYTHARRESYYLILLAIVQSSERLGKHYGTLIYTSYQQVHPYLL